MIFCITKLKLKKKILKHFHTSSTLSKYLTNPNSAFFSFFFSDKSIFQVNDNLGGNICFLQI